MILASAFESPLPLPIAGMQGQIAHESKEGKQCCWPEGFSAPILDLGAGAQLVPSCHEGWVSQWHLPTWTQARTEELGQGPVIQTDHEKCFAVIILHLSLWGYLHVCLKG